MRPGMSVRPPPSMTVTLASAGGWILPLETRSMMFPRTITLPGSLSFSALPSKIRTFLNRVTATLGAAVVALAASGLPGGDDTVAGGLVVAAPVAALPASDPDGAPEGAQPAESMSATIAVRNRTLSRMEALLSGGLLVVIGPFIFSAFRGSWSGSARTKLSAMTGTARTVLVLGSVVARGMSFSLEAVPDGVVLLTDSGRRCGHDRTPQFLGPSSVC